MAKFVVTPELANIIKTTRVQNGIAAREVASQISKSPSYISRLENAGIKHIDEIELRSIFECIYKAKANDNSSLGQILEQIYQNFTIQMTDKEINDQLWFDTFDTVTRQIPVPIELIDDINRRIEALNISVHYLCKKINSNEPLLDIKNIESYPFNIWQAIVVNHELKHKFIRILVHENEIADILGKRTLVSCYLNLLAIVFYLFRIERCNVDVQPTSDDDSRFLRESYSYLNSYRFYSIGEKHRLSKLAQTENEKNQLLTSFDRENQDLVRNILKAIGLFSDLNIQRANQDLQTVSDNLKWDPSFIFALNGLKFHQLGNISFTKKRDLLIQIKGLIKKFSELSDQDKKMDIYEL